MEMLKLSDFLEDRYIIGQENDSRLKGKEIIFKNVNYDDIKDVKLGVTNAEIVYNLINILIDNIELDITKQEFEVIADKCQKKEYVDLINAMFGKFEDLCLSIKTMNSMQNKINNLIENKFIELPKQIENNVLEVQEIEELIEDNVLEVEQVEEKSKEQIEGELMEAIKHEDDPTKMLELMDKLKQVQELK